MATRDEGSRLGADRPTFVCWTLSGRQRHGHIQPLPLVKLDQHYHRHRGRAYAMSLRFKLPHLVCADNRIVVGTNSSG